MDCKDLMVGDWIQVKRGFDGHLTNEKIKGLIDNDDESYPIILATEETVSPNDIVPIKLTEEILVKNGFASSDGYAYLHLDENNFLEFCYYNHRLSKIYMGIEIDEWNKRVTIRDVVFVSNCNYVHELQHLLRLCGIEKEIEL